MSEGAEKLNMKVYEEVFIFFLSKTVTVLYYLLIIKSLFNLNEKFVLLWN